MYTAFDAFLKQETWHTDHALDERRFYSALNAVVRHPDFRADAMRDYFREHVGPAAVEAFEPYISEWTTKADAVREFLELTEGLTSS